ncbi:hypothetical protein QKV95_gp008 [Poseidoniales virus YSH_150918]|uniref:Uncharacterized protein n=1 Tax=Poseidoniales virus YSH_150918 TaxID=3071324 RepID=A0A976UBG0_9CAUD|nr:hypothetical protein QKV95_gp008 [Yangshan Harbor Poseidoniales virus]UVF62482.1 hypothetical protein [Poseidoniales virus YSH_150918]
MKLTTMLMRIEQIEENIASGGVLAPQKLALEGMIGQAKSQDDDQKREAFWVSLRGFCKAMGFEFPSAESSNPKGYSTLDESIQSNVRPVHNDLRSAIVTALSPLWENLQVTARHGGGAYQDVEELVDIRLMNRFEVSIVEAIQDNRYNGKVKNGVIVGYNHIEKEEQPADESTDDSSTEQTEGA